jgi:alpha-amylase
MTAPKPCYHGDGRDLLLQGFHWDSHTGAPEGPAGRKTWYRILTHNAEAIRRAGFTWVWFPPSSDSLAPQGYIPRRWNRLDSAFGSESELRAALAALAPVKGMADIVLNHRVGVHTPGADFDDPPFPDNRAAICRDDESGVGTGNHDTGERHPCGRDLDHTNPGVREAIKNYLRLLKSIGFRGFRYDLVKGYHGRFVGEYNESTLPEFSVGEFFDTNRQRVCDWIDSTGGRSCAFDFPTRYLLFEATLKDDYSALRSNSGGRTLAGGLIGYWPGRAVTFIDNHDTEYRREREHQANYDSTRHFPGPKVDMGYAYTLTHPGTPCVFWPHFFDFGARTREKIEQLIGVRRDFGIRCESGLEIREADRGLYAAVIDGRVAMKLGSRDWTPGHGWNITVWGDRFAVWTR